jgi:hypothetical protein
MQTAVMFRRKEDGMEEQLDSKIKGVGNEYIEKIFSPDIESFAYNKKLLPTIKK